MWFESLLNMVPIIIMLSFPMDLQCFNMLPNLVIVLFIYLMRSSSSRVYVALFSSQSIWLLYNPNLGDASIAKNLIDNCTEIFKKNILGRTPLLQAARNGNCFSSYSCVLCDVLKWFLWRTSHAWVLVIIDWYYLVIKIFHRFSVVKRILDHFFTIAKCFYVCWQRWWRKCFTKPS